MCENVIKTTLKNDSKFIKSYLIMARKTADGTKFSKKDKAKDKKNYNSYNQKSVRLKAELIEKRKNINSTLKPVL